MVNDGVLASVRGIIQDGRSELALHRQHLSSDCRRRDETQRTTFLSFFDSCFGAGSDVQLWNYLS
jgi:hypothetical protein